MARFAGRFGRVYMGIASDTAAAEPILHIASWSMAAETDKIEVTAMGDTSKVYVAGLPDASGEFSGFVDDVSVQTYTAAVDGLPRKFYLYPNVNIAGRYFYGTIFADFSANASVDGSTELSSSWSAATPIQFRPV